MGDRYRFRYSKRTPRGQAGRKSGRLEPVGPETLEETGACQLPLESMHDVYLRTDLAGVVQAASPSVLFQMGSERDEVVGRCVSMLGLTAAGRPFLDHLKDMGCLIDCEVQQAGREGQTRYFSANARLLFNRERVPIAAEAFLRDISERKLTEKRLLHMSYHDLLTGLPNGRLFRDRASQIMAHARRHGDSFALLFLDLDRFKEVNDREGHSVGDALLRAIAHRVTGCLREADTMARLGGDEFVALLPDARRRTEAEAVARRILDALSEPFRLAGREITASVSIGIGVYPADGTDLETLLRVADQAMYRAKRSTRDDVEKRSA